MPLREASSEEHQPLETSGGERESREVNETQWMKEKKRKSQRKAIGNVEWKEKLVCGIEIRDRTTVTLSCRR